MSKKKYNYCLFFNDGYNYVDADGESFSSDVVNNIKKMYETTVFKHNESETLEERWPHTSVGKGDGDESENVNVI